MIGLFLVTHATYGESLIQCVCHVLGQRPPQLVQLGVGPDDSPDTVVPLAQSLLATVDDGSGVLVMTDLYGATPANIATRLLVPGRIEGVAGLNLPMLLRALTYRTQNIQTLSERVVAGGRDGILAISPPTGEH